MHGTSASGTLQEQEVGIVNTTTSGIVTLGTEPAFVIRPS
ncbi:hypothetical protein IWX65_001601 [Arthrobacter sp. CAN_A214]